VRILTQLAEAKIAAAMERGEFDDLPGAGKPLELEDLSHVPPELRAAYKVLRNAQVLPPEAELRREIYSLGRLIDATAHPDDRDQLRRRRRQAELHYAILAERRASGRIQGSPRIAR
jgi:hypothetical protein